MTIRPALSRLIMHGSTLHDVITMRAAVLDAPHASAAGGVTASRGSCSPRLAPVTPPPLPLRPRLVQSRLRAVQLRPRPVERGLRPVQPRLGHVQLRLRPIQLRPRPVQPKRRATRRPSRFEYACIAPFVAVVVEAHDDPTGFEPADHAWQHLARCHHHACCGARRSPRLCSRWCHSKPRLV